MKLESAVKAVFLIANVALTLAYASAWVIFRHAIHWGEASPVQVHLSLAGIAVLISLFANLCIIFYFVGTGVWIRDQAREMLGRDKARAMRVWELYEKANKLKGKAFPFPTMALVLGLFAFILGGANQVGAIPAWLHPLIATLDVLISWAAVPFSFRAMGANLALLDQASQEIEAIT